MKSRLLIILSLIFIFPLMSLAKPHGSIGISAGTYHRHIQPPYGHRIMPPAPHIHHIHPYYSFYYSNGYYPQNCNYYNPYYYNNYYTNCCNNCANSNFAIKVAL